MRPTEIFLLESIESGEAVGLWVSLGFSSAMAANDVLHIVYGKDDEMAESDSPIDGGIYLERFDQVYSCENGVNQITVSEEGVEVDLNDRGVADLAFTGKVLFTRPQQLKDYAEAVKIFEQMAEQQGGQIIQVLHSIEDER